MVQLMNCCYETACETLMQKAEEYRPGAALNV